MKIILDTNVYNNKKFLIWLKDKENEIDSFINSIIYLELGYLYKVRNKWRLFTDVLNEFGIIYISASKNIVEEAIKLALHFKNAPQGAAYFFRDCLIGAVAKSNKLTLITNNTEHFPYFSKIEIFTPQTFIDYFEKTSKSQTK